MKRRNIIYGVVCTLFCFVCLSCSDETENAFAPTETGLILQINAGQNTFTRADGTTNSSAESAWDNVIHYLDVFIFDSTTGDLVPNCYFHFGDGTNNIVDPVCLISGNWKTRFQGYETCDVYVVANLHIHSSGDNTASETLKNVKNLSELQQLTDEYQYIYQPVSPDSKKPFTMSGYRMGWEPAASSNVYTIPVELTRLAAKIEISLDLQLTGEITVNETTYQYPTNEDIGQLQYSVHNYAINALVLPGNDGTFGYTIASAAEANLKFVDKDDSDKSVPKIIAYTYPTEWTNDILKETYVILNAQLRSITKSNEGTYQYMDNYYKIPLRLSTDENKKLERNHWYKVKATISALGNATPNKPVELTDVHYEVAPWNDIDIDINGDTPMYLELSEYDVVMRNVDTYDLTFASSSQITSATINNIYYINKNGKPITVTNDEIKAVPETGLNGKLSIQSPIPENKTIRYMTLTVTNDQGLSKEVTIKQYPLEYITGIAGLYSYLDEYEGFWPSNLYQLTYNSWAVDKNTEQQYIINKSLENSKIVSGLNENIGNNAVMKSKFYVENESGEGRIFRIDLNYFKEYEKVPAGKGNYNNVYTYKGRNKGNYTIKATESLYGDYTKNDDNDYIEKNVDGQGGYTLEITNVGKNSGEYSHSYVETKGGNYVKTTVDNFKSDLVYYLEDNGTASNNQMYHVVITSTSEDYQLGRPIMDEEDKEIVDPDNLDNDNLVSPSFMLASQLGNSSTISWEDAKNQCKNYVEVGINKEVYNDWRLPTAAEINIIIKYQTDPKVNTGNNNAVMDYVLNYGEQSTPNYWISRKNYSMKIPNSGKGTLEQGESNSKRRVRCVRDFHVGEPTE